MSKDATAQDAAPAARPQGPSGKASLYMRETSSGTWIVGEEGGRRGGRFFTRKDALNFIRREFGPDAHIAAARPVHEEAA